MTPRDERPFRGSVLAVGVVIVVALLGVTVSASWVLIVTGVLTWR